MRGKESKKTGPSKSFYVMLPETGGIKRGSNPEGIVKKKGAS